MNAVKLVAIFAENKPGQTARVTGILANAQDQHPLHHAGQHRRRSA